MSSFAKKTPASKKKGRNGVGKPGKKAVTIYDIAERANVSPITVSRSLRSNHSNPIKAATAVRIREIARELNYRPSPTARALILRKTFNVGFCVNDPSFSFYSSLFQPLCEALQAELNAGGYRLGYYFFKPGSDPQFRSFLEENQVVDAIIVLGRNLSTEEADFIRNSGVHAISIYGEVPGLASLVPDDLAAGRRAAQYLWDRGFRSVTLLSHWVGSKDRLEWNGRILGFRERAAELGLAYRDLTPEWDPAYDPAYAKIYGKIAPDLLERIFESGTPGRCIFATSDRMAIGLVRQADARGLVLGRDVSVLGFDNIEGQLEQPWGEPRLSTLDRPRAEIGRTAARLAMSGPEQTPPSTQRFEVSLIERGSVGFGPHASESSPARTP